jgi:hypothetical protein
MQRVLALVLSLVLVAAAAVTPAFACLSTGASLGTQSHECCDKVVPSAPTAPCCLISQPARDRALSQSRIDTTQDHHADINLIVHAGWCQFPDDTSPGRGAASPPAHGARAVAIYLEHPALLI